VTDNKFVVLRRQERRFVHWNPLTKGTEAAETVDALGGLVNTDAFWNGDVGDFGGGTYSPPDAGESAITEPGGKGTTVSNALSDDAFVVRGGLSTPETLQANLEGGGISANSAPRMSVDELSHNLVRYNKIGVTTVGDIRAIGGDVTPSPIATNLFHATIEPGPGGTQELSGLFKIMDNPWARVPR